MWPIEMLYKEKVADNSLPLPLINLNNYSSQFDQIDLYQCISNLYL